MTGPQKTVLIGTERRWTGSPVSGSTQAGNRCELWKRAVATCCQARQRAREKGVPFDLTTEWVHAKLKAGVCERTLLPFVYGSRGARSLFTPSIDRRWPEKGYTEDNCRLVIWGFNCAKGVGSDRDVFILARGILGLTTDKDLEHLTALTNETANGSTHPLFKKGRWRAQA